MSKHEKQGIFITVEGIEGVGKSTNIVWIQNHLMQHHVPVTVTREPGGTPIAEAIRQVLLTPHTELMTRETELLLMFAGRAQHIQTVILPALSAGQWVLCDRFTDASYAYQGGGRQIAYDRIAVLEEWVQGDLRPDLTLLLDAPVKLALSRAKHRSTPDRFESETEAFFNRVRQGYLDRAKQNPQRYRIIDASCEIQEVQQQITIILTEILQRHNLW